MTLRSEWPKGLRALFWLSVLGFFIGSGQLFYFVVMRGELGPPPSLQGSYAIAGYALNLVIAYAGLRAMRRLFVLTTAAAALLSFFVTLHFLAVIFGEWASHGAGIPTAEIIRDMPYVGWNLAIVVVAAVVVGYLVSEHIVVSGDRPSDRASPLPPPVAIDIERAP